MKPESTSKKLLSITRAKAKMYEFDVPAEYHIRIADNPARLLTLAVGLLGDIAAEINSDNENSDRLNELKENLKFSAYFFDAYRQSRLNLELDPYLLILGATAYYLCDLPGSASVLAERLGENALDLDCLGLERLMLWLLRGDFRDSLDPTPGPYQQVISEISQTLVRFYADGSGERNLLTQSHRLRRQAYENGTPRQLLFADASAALVRKRHYNSTWYSLPRYSGLSAVTWSPILGKSSFMRELWPAQHLLGQRGVFQGVSATVQMPTSAGKTRAAEIIIRSAFLSGRTSLAIVVAPFRALCHEIRDSFVAAFHDEAVSVDELSDVLQLDFQIMSLLGRQQIVVLTPEKLLYVLRQSPELAASSGLMIYDEGHQFDSETRGVTYELLLSWLRGIVSPSTQKVLISAVISNGDIVNSWLNGEQSQLIQGTDLNPTFRTVAFASWLDQLGRLEFVDGANPDEREFFVPRIIESNVLQAKPNEKKVRIFPEKGDGKTISLYLGLKLVRNGAVAIFCGRRDTATGLGEKLVDTFDRKPLLQPPVDYSSVDEINKLRSLYAANLGDNAIATRAAALGALNHHANIPYGVRLAVEYAMKEGLAKFVICTSTLAQGVNLPIRYLIVTSVYQGSERIKVRDFHNLMGRAGRSGMHTEGSVVFADPELYDTRNNLAESWRWRQVKELLEPGNSEPCTSALLSVFEPLYSDRRNFSIGVEPLKLVESYLEDPIKVSSIVANAVKEHADKGFTLSGLENQVSRKLIVVRALESYLMASSNGSSEEAHTEEVEELARGTLAYYMADDQRRNQITDLFRLLAINIQNKAPQSSTRKTFGKTLFGLRECLRLEEWTTHNLDQMTQCETSTELLSALWPALIENIKNSAFRTCRPQAVLFDIAKSWIAGERFNDLLKRLTAIKARFGLGLRPRKPKIDHTVELCENALGFEGALVIGAITEFCRSSSSDETLIKNLSHLQKRVRYGLNSIAAITFYELGFADRVISTELSSLFPEVASRSTAIDALSVGKSTARNLLTQYPAYFMASLQDLLT